MSYSGSMRLPTATATTRTIGKIDRSRFAILTAKAKSTAVPPHNAIVAIVCIVVLSGRSYGGAGGCGGMNPAIAAPH